MAEEKKINYKFSTGLEVTGTAEEIVAIAKALKVEVDFLKLGVIPAGYYPSETKGMVKIVDMGEWHLRRALLKRAKDYYAEMFDAKDSLETFLTKFTLLTEDRIVSDLFVEIQKRIK